MTRRTERRERLRRATYRLTAMPGIEPETWRTILQAEIDRPLQGGERDLQHAGLFGDAHKQTNLF